MSAGLLPPQAIEVEEAILSSMLLENESRVHGLSQIKNPGVFYLEKHRIVFEVMQSLYNKGDAVDLITVVTQLRKVEQLDRVGGASFIVELTNKVNSGMNLESYIAILKEHWIRRENIGMGNDLIKASYDDSNDAIDTLTSFQNRSVLITDELSSKQALTGKQLIRKSFEAIANAKSQKDKGEVSGVPSGIQEIDSFTGGFQDTDLIIIAARPGMGKTALVLEFLKYPAVTMDMPIGMFSLEMSGTQLMNRLISSETDVYYSRMARGEISDYDLKKILNNCNALITDNIIVDDTPGLNISQLRAKASMMKMKYNIRMIIVDYLQLMSSGIRSDNRAVEVGYISRQIKVLAGELDVPIISASQFSRSADQRANKRPTLSDLKDSSGIEQDANTVIFLHYDEYDPDKYGVTECIVAKRRDGATGSVLLVYRKPFTKFENAVSAQFSPDA